MATTGRARPPDGVLRAQRGDGALRAQRGDGALRARRPGGALRARWTTRVPASLVLVVLGYLALSLVFSLRTPAWENNDEAAHVLYVEHLVAHGTLPPIGAANGNESHQAPLYYAVVAVWQRVDGIPAFVPQVPAAAPGTGTGVRHRLFVDDDTAVHRQQAGEVHRLRLVSVGCGLATVVAAYTTGWLLTGTTATATAIAATVAAWPKFLVVDAAVTNSSLVETLCAWALPCWLVWHRTRSPAWAVAVGGVLGAAVLTQVTALPLAGLLLALTAAVAAARRDLRSPLLAGAAAVAVCGWWFVRNAVRYGDVLATRVTDDYLRAISGGLGLIRPRPALSPAILAQQLPIVGHSTWWSGSWDQLQLPHAVDAVLWAAAAACAVAALATPPGRHAVVLLASAASVAAWLLIVRQTTHGQGRYLLTGITAWAVVLVAGSARLLPGRRHAVWLWPALLLAVDVFVVATELVPYGGW